MEESIYLQNGTSLDSMKFHQSLEGYSLLTPGRQASLTYGGVRLLQKCNSAIYN